MTLQTKHLPTLVKVALLVARIPVHVFRTCQAIHWRVQLRKKLRQPSLPSTTPISPVSPICTEARSATPSDPISTEENTLERGDRTQEIPSLPVIEPALLRTTAAIENTGSLSYKTQDTQTQDTLETQDTSSHLGDRVALVAGDTADGQSDRTEGNRAELVTALLDEAFSQGLTTYPQLIEYVRENTGTGCSRRSIARWKKERNLTEDAA